jgi:hypothetical protein
MLEGWIISRDLERPRTCPDDLSITPWEHGIAANPAAIAADAAVQSTNPPARTAS